MEMNQISNFSKKVSSSAPAIPSLSFSLCLSLSLSLSVSLENGDTTNNPYNIANIFNNCFASMAKTTKSNVKYSYEHCLKLSVI